jgi:phosphatidylserine/phosphatidylglycerophosphate/cardiolipin synthase-like enzyme
MSTNNLILKKLSSSTIKIRTLLSNNQLPEFTRMMEEIGFTHPTSKDMNKLNLSPSNRDRLKRYLKEIKDKDGLMAISLSLIEHSKSGIEPPMEICWTGPSYDSHVRMTWPALSEIILSATESILIVGYVINTKMGKILDHLEKKSEAGVKLVFMIDRLGEKRDFLKWVKRLHPPLELYDRPKDQKDPLSALHIKCVVVDERTAMFGSANLTYHGMKGNIELGLVVRDEKIVKKIVHLLNGLRRELIKFEL